MNSFRHIKMQVLSLVLMCSCLIPQISSAQSIFTINGFSLIDAPELDGGYKAAYIVAKGSESSFDFGTLAAGTDLDKSETYGDDSFTFVGASVVTKGVKAAKLTSEVNISITDSSGNDSVVDRGDRFAVIVFNQKEWTTLNTLNAGTIFWVWTDPTWVIPDDGLYSSEFSMSGETYFTHLTLSAPSTFSGIIVPEPSTYALLIGIFALAYVVIRRRSVSENVELPETA